MPQELVILLNEVLATLETHDSSVLSPSGESSHPANNFSEARDNFFEVSSLDHVEGHLSGLPHVDIEPVGIAPEVNRADLSVVRPHETSPIGSDKRVSRGVCGQR
jgi:hypothetical protein